MALVLHVGILLVVRCEATDTKCVKDITRSRGVKTVVTAWNGNAYGSPNTLDRSTSAFGKR
jgi:hypothetical protein